MFYVGVFAPGIVALFLTWQLEGSAALTELIRRLVRWNVGGRWYVFALGYMAAVKITVALLHRLVAGEWPRFGAEPWYLMLAATIFSTILLGQAGEELGWRGYALPRLAERFGLAGASVILGLIWAVWHLPLFFLAGADTTGQSFPLYLLQVTALSVAIAWVYRNTGGSLLLTMLLHAAINNTKDIVPSAVTMQGRVFTLDSSLAAWLTVGVLWIGAAYFLTRMSRPGGGEQVAPA